MSDLAKHTGSMGKLRLQGVGLEDIDDSSWAGGHGPVRPLLQLMAVLPPSRCIPLPERGFCLIRWQNITSLSQLHLMMSRLLQQKVCNRAGVLLLASRTPRAQQWHVCQAHCASALDVILT